MTYNSCKVLLVQDSFHSIKAITKSLNTNDFDVLTCSDNQALVLGIRENPDIIIMDILFKDKNGFKLLLDLKNHWCTRHIPVVIATQINTQQYWDESFRLGASAYMLIDRHMPYLAPKIKKIIQHEKTHVHAGN